MAGYYCNGSAKISNPPEGACPRGHYCPEGSYKPTPCPRGSFANTQKNENITDCKPCSAGKYCDPNANIVEERDCDAGYVCILGRSEWNESVFRLRINNYSLKWRYLPPLRISTAMYLPFSE